MMAAMATTDDYHREGTSVREQVKKIVPIISLYDIHLTCLYTLNKPFAYICLYFRSGVNTDVSNFTTEALFIMYKEFFDI
jgi:hypothetical protein